MKLRNVALSCIIILSLVVMAAEFGVIHFVVREGFDELERNMVAADVRRVRNEFLQEVQALDIFLWDWSSWDDTYEFARDRNEEYIDSNLGLETFTEQSLAVIAVIGTDGRLVYGRAVNADKEDDGNLLAEFLATYKDADPPQLPDGGGRGGFVLLTDGPLYFSSRPILRSDGQGPPTGTLIMAKLLTHAVVEAISKRLELAITAYTAKGPLTPDTVAAALHELETGKDTFLSLKDETTIDGFTMLKDISDQPLLVLDVAEPRSISQHGRSVALYNTILMALVLAAIALLMFYILQRRVISRVERLNDEVQGVDMSGTTPGHVTVAGDDEIAQLGYNVNRMLIRLAEDQKILRKAHDELEDKVAERTAELEAANQELLSLDKAKSHFLSSTSHELRTPLTAINGFVKLMERSFIKHLKPHLDTAEGAAPRVDTFLDNFKVVRLETERLGRLIDDLLDLNKIEAGRVEWRDEDVNVADLVRGAVDTISGQVKDNPNVDLLVELPAGLPSIHVDRDRFHQVLINLLNNAAKFTEKGHVKAAVRPAENGLEFAVEDTGSGIPDEDREQIFEIFYQSQAEQDLSGKPFGTGLGLAICKEIVEHYGGAIWVESELGKGSAFKFRLPVR